MPRNYNRDVEQKRSDRMVRVSPQETRRRADGETDVQVKTRYDKERSAYAKMKNAEARVTELGDMERGKSLSQGLAAGIAKIGAKKALRKAGKDYEQYSPYSRKKKK